MFKKFFGKKNDGFFMQVDENAAPKAAAETEVAKPTEATPVAAETVPVLDVVAEPAKATAGKTATKTKKTSIKDKKDKKEKEDKPAAEQAVVAVAAPAFTNFATDYLVTPAVAGNRRRPGANMKSFMSMAQEVKTKGFSSTGQDIKTKKASKG